MRPECESFLDVLNDVLRQVGDNAVADGTVASAGLGHDIVTDLGIDSLSMMEIVVAIEDDQGWRVGVDLSVPIRTIGDLFESTRVGLS